ncbi:hypothetical protein [Aquabacter cavernae]|uniref:hypothetical protein n=1 Tax=Aquabacter cavernae TaxID=2496029 RepID=UPI000F8C48A6|nr:hypothetical protein [Aquabacter cavernae]
MSFGYKGAISQVTTLLSWISVDSRGPSRIYIVGDSRITWGSESYRWDSGRKVFASRTADIFGYCGDVLYPTLVLGQLGDLAGQSLLWDQQANAEMRHDKIVEYLKRSFERRHNAPDYDFTILHGARDGEGLRGSFYLWKTSYRVGRRTWTDQKIDVGVPLKSAVLVKLGSGDHALDREIDAWDANPQGGTARSIFSAFCDALEKKSDPLSGGVPQIVSLDRRGGGKVIGFIADGAHYIYGLPIQPLPELSKIEWVDSLFQRMSPETMTLLPNAQRHARVEKGKKGGLAAFIGKSFGKADS